MANLMYNDVSDAGAKATIEFVQNLEEWLLEMLEAMEANDHNKIMAEELGKITSIPIKDLEEYECFTFDGTNTDVARAILEKYNIDTDHIGMKDGKVYCAFKRGRNLEGYKKLQFDIENNVIDVEKIYEEYLEEVRGIEDEPLSEEDLEYDDDLDENLENEVENTAKMPGGPEKEVIEAMEELEEAVETSKPAASEHTIDESSEEFASVAQNDRADDAATIDYTEDIVVLRDREKDENAPIGLDSKDTSYEEKSVTHYSEDDSRNNEVIERNNKEEIKEEVKSSYAGAIEQTDSSAQSSNVDSHSYLDSNSYVSTSSYGAAKEAAYAYADTSAAIERAERARQNQGDGFSKAEFNNLGNGNDLPVSNGNTINESHYTNSSVKDNNEKPSDSKNHYNEAVSKINSNEDKSSIATIGPNGITEDNSRRVSSFTIDRIDTRELTRKVQNLSDVTSKPYENPVTKAYKATENYRGKQSLSGLSASISESAHHSLERHRSSAFVAGLAYSETINGIREGMPQVIHNFVTANGYRYEGFQSKSSARATMESFNQAMLNRKLISYDPKNKSYDYSKFNDEIQRANKGRTKAERDAAWLSLGKKLGIINMSADNCKSQIEQLAKAGRNIHSYEEANKQKNKDKANLKQLTKRKMFGETEIYKGINRLNLARGRAEATYMVAKRAALIQAKVASKIVCMIPPANLARKKIVVANEARKSKREEARVARRVSKNEKKQERKNSRIEKRNVRHEARLKRSGAYRKADKINQNISAIWQKAINSAFARKSMAALHKSRQIFHNIMKFSPSSLIAKGIDLKTLVMKKIMKYGICFVGSIVLASAVISIASASITSITAFFTSDDDDIMKSNMGKAYTAAMSVQEKWVNNMKDSEISNGYFSRGSLKFTDEYLSASEYASKIAHVVSYDSSAHSYIVNPFDFEPEDEGILKSIKKFDGGTEVYVIGKSDPEKTGNIKEILSMASIYFEHDADSSDNDTSSTKSTHYDQSTEGNSGYFDDDEEEEDNTPARGFKKYVKELFKQSHQTVIDLEYITLPTSYSINHISEEDAIYSTAGDHLLSYDVVTQCSEYDKGGCTSYDSFYYRKTSGGIKIGVYDKEKKFHVLENSVYPTSASCYIAGSNEGTASISSLDAELSSSSNCYIGGVYYPQSEITYSSWSEKKPEVNTTISGNALSIAKKLGESGGTYQDARFDIVSTQGGFTYYLTIDEKIIEECDMDYGMQPLYDNLGNPVMEKYYKLEKGKYVEAERQKYERKIVREYRVKTVPCHCYVIWNCAGNHSGRFCGGHLKAKITGLVYASTKEQSDEDNAEIVGKVEEGEYVSNNPLKTSIDKSKLSSAVDIFDIDQLITHSTEQEGWNGWTQDNMSLAMLKYNQDWEGLYGFNISNGLGGPGHPFGNPFHSNWKTDPSIVITEYYGPRVNPIKGTSEVHHGIDIAAPMGTPVYSICKGTVSFAGYKSSQGNYVTVTDEEGYTVHYMHMSKISVTEGQVIEEGEKIGEVGSTGDSTGPHLHLGIHHVLDNSSYEYINPIFFVSQTYFSEEDKAKTE